LYQSCKVNLWGLHKGSVTRNPVVGKGCAVMKNLNVSAKLLIGFGIAALFTLAVGLISIHELGRLNKDYTDAINNHGKPLKDAGGFLEAIHALRSETRAAIIFTGNNTLLMGTEAAMDNWCAAFEKSAQDYGKTIVDPGAKSLFNCALERYETVFKPSMYSILNDAKSGVPAAELTAQMINVARPSSDFVADALKRTMEIKIGKLNKSEENGTALYKHGLSVMTTLLILSLGISLFLGVYISAQISKPLHAAVKMIKEMSMGHLSERLLLNRKDEIGVMADTMDKFAVDLQVLLIGTLNKVADGELTMALPNKDDNDEFGAALKRIVHPLRELIIEDGGRVLNAAAGKDLSQRMTGEYKGDFAKMKNNINTVMENLDGALYRVADVVGQVSGESEEIAMGAQSLASGSSEQADALTYVSSSLEEMADMTKRSADNANVAKEIASEARAAAGEGDVAMLKMGEAISNIKLSSDNTAKIVKTINDIAFQTSLLALNAAVEAARAGEAGRGFAAVAGEVRSLAMRSAEAAKDTAMMIGESVKSADIGVKLNEGVAASLAKIVKSTEKMGVLIDDIAVSSNEQARGIEQVSNAVSKMSRVTQQSAAHAEESAGAAEWLSKQASELANLVGNFTLSDSAEEYYYNEEAADVGVDTKVDTAVTETVDTDTHIDADVDMDVDENVAANETVDTDTYIDAAVDVVDVEVVDTTETTPKHAHHKKQPHALHHSIGDRQKHHSQIKAARSGGGQIKEFALLKENELADIMIED